MARLLGLDPVVVLTEPDEWLQAIRLAAAEEVAEAQEEERRRIKSKSPRK